MNVKKEILNFFLAIIAIIVLVHCVIYLLYIYTSILIGSISIIIGMHRSNYALVLSGAISIFILFLDRKRIYHVMNMCGCAPPCRHEYNSANIPPYNGPFLRVPTKILGFSLKFIKKIFT